MAEVHDSGAGELQAFLALLRAQGFSNCQAGQDDALRGSSLYNVYAVR